MSSAYGAITASSNLSKLPENSLPMSFTLSDGTQVLVKAVTDQDEVAIAQLHSLLNFIIEEGKTYPHEFILDADAFKSYFNVGFYCVEKESNAILGGFYIKPNFPGRCSHICNGGFIVAPAQRGRGVGKVMGSAYLQLAPLMGFKASIFNLVFEDNVASVRLWTSLGFKVTGRVPQAGRLKGKSELVDALVFHYKFDENI
jgi:L-amino acid N-acyltransferase YncA